MTNARQMASNTMEYSPIGDLVESVSTWSPLRSNVDDRFDYIDLSSVDQDTKTIVGSRSISCGEAPSRARQIVAKGDVLISTVRPNLNGVASVPDRLDGATASTGFCVLRPRAKKLDSSYLFQWVKSPAFVADMVSKATGASYPAVSDRIISESKVPLPPLAEQKRIAAILDKADAIRRNRQQAIRLTDEFLRSVFLDMFGDPVTNLKGWDNSYVLGSVAEIVSGVTKGRKLEGKKVRELPYLAVANVQDKRLNLEGVKSIPATDDEILRFRLIKDDLLLTEGGDPDKLGRGTLWNDELAECIHQNHIFRVRLTDQRIDPVFLNWLVGSERGKKYFLRSAKQTTGIASINMTQLRAFPMLIPPIKLQKCFAATVYSVGRRVSRLSQQTANTEALFSSLQQRAFRGEL